MAKSRWSPEGLWHWPRLCLALARTGANIVLDDRPGSEPLQETAESIREFGRQCWTIEADVFSTTGITSLVKQAVEVAGAIGILGSGLNIGSYSSTLYCALPACSFSAIQSAICFRRLSRGGGICSMRAFRFRSPSLSNCSARSECPCRMRLAPNRHCR